ncbi:threonine/serine exporter ThrE family protein [Kitasatospora sp. NPDC006697]|uniref:threonine/serine ThrE exporter family protein n=1 Tax=Kitasatospora sp. NPDC006697 TaxID=3364020 RepID=UPI00367E6187
MPKHDRRWGRTGFRRRTARPGGQRGVPRQRGGGSTGPGEVRPGPPAPEAAWPDRMLPLLRTPMSERPRGAGRPTAAEAAPVLELALMVGELLLAGGEAAEDVEAAMLAVARAYQVHPCDPHVTFTRVAISYRAGPTAPPLTAACSVRRPAGDYARLAALFRLVTEIAAGGIEVADAHRRVSAVYRRARCYPGWLLLLACGLMAGAATLLVGGRADERAWLVFASAVVAALAGDRLARLVVRHDLPEFYRYVLAATPAALCGILLSFNGLQLRGSVVITGGLYALLPGWSLVAAAQDGLAGFYLTATARLLETLYLTTGVVVGVVTVLYIGVRNGADLAARDVPACVPNPPLQLAAAVLLTLAFAICLNTEPVTLPAVLLNSTAGWASYGVLAKAGVGPIVATGFAACLVGLSGQLMARRLGTSALPYVTAALGPLLPGSVLYFALWAFVRRLPETGVRGLGRASAIAMALAIGVSLGRETARLFLPAPGAGAPARPRGAHRR